MIARLLGAVQFLTVLPAGRHTADAGQSSLFFPVIGAVLGAFGGYLLHVSSGYLPFTLVCLIVLTFWWLITGGSHERGFAHAVDAFRAGRPPEKIHAILQGDSLGWRGACALILLVLVRWQALRGITLPPVAALAAALALGRASMVALAWISSPAGSGRAAAFSRTLTTPVAVAVVTQAFLFAMWPGSPLASILCGGTTAIVLLARAYFMRRIGGVTGDCLNATEQIVETFCLIVSTCRPCTS